jgi:hypothetical protein
VPLNGTVAWSRYLAPNEVRGTTPAPQQSASLLGALCLATLNSEAGPFPLLVLRAYNAHDACTGNLVVAGVLFWTLWIYHRVGLSSKSSRPGTMTSAISMASLKDS